MKLFKKIAAVVMGLVMAIGTGVVILNSGNNAVKAEAADSYEKATGIAAGDTVLLVCETRKMELSGISTSGTKYGTGVAYTTAPAGKSALTVEAGSTSGTFSFKMTDGKYLYWSSGNSLASNSSKEANSSWKVTFSNGNATIVNAKDNNRKLQWNASSPRFACYTSSQTAVQLYKKTVAQQTTTLRTPEGFVFDQENLKITWNAVPNASKYSVTIGEHTGEATEPSYPISDLDLEVNTIYTINVKAIGDGITYSDSETANFDFEIVDSSIIISWNLVKDASKLSVGDQIVIAAKSSNYAISTTQNNNNRARAQINKSDESITFGDDVQILTLTEGTVEGTFGFYTGSGYLYAAGSSSNYLKTQNTNDENSSWKIVIDSNDVASIVAIESSNRNVLQYNNDNNPPIFSCYDSQKYDELTIYLRETIVNESITGINIEEENFELFEGQSKQLTVTVETGNIAGVGYSTNNESVATVSKLGEVVAIGEGTATIRAYASEDEYDEVTVSVKADSIASITWSSSLGGENLYCFEGHEIKLENFGTVTANYLSGKTATISASGYTVNLVKDGVIKKENIFNGTENYIVTSEDNGCYFTVNYNGLVAEEENHTVLSVAQNIKEISIQGSTSTNKDVSISFANTSQRTSQDGSSQVWKNGDVIFTNNKAASTSAVVSNVNPVRLYAHSEIILQAPGNISKIIFNANTTGYASELKNSITSGTVTLSDKVVTVEFDEEIESLSNIFTIEDLSAQVRLDSLTLSYVEGGNGPIEISNSNAKSQYLALKFADEFTAKLGCDIENGNTTQDISSKWNGEDGIVALFETYLNSISEVGTLQNFKDLFKYATSIDSRIEGVGNPEYKIHHMLSLYDYVVDKHNLSDFLNEKVERNEAPDVIANGLNSSNLIKIVSTNNGIPVVIIAVISALAVGAYFFLRKKKEQ